MNVFRAALSRNFWITGIAIARYIPRAFRTKQVDGNLFFTEEKRREYRRSPERFSNGFSHLLRRQARCPASTDQTDATAAVEFPSAQSITEGGGDSRARWHL
jgi:hypothetical protein